jgi:hypothetical protein
LVGPDLIAKIWVSKYFQALICGLYEYQGLAARKNLQIHAFSKFLSGENLRYQRVAAEKNWKCVFSENRPVAASDSDLFESVRGRVRQKNGNVQKIFL